MMKKILIIDDHAVTRQLVKWALADSNYALHEASSGEAGLRVVRDLLPDLVLLDILMPGAKDGYQVCREMRDSSSLSDIRIVLLSANDTDADRQRGMDAGADAYLVKPFKPSALRAQIDKLLAA